MFSDEMDFYRIVVSIREGTSKGELKLRMQIKGNILL
jgi:hypothetical protein